MTHKIIYPKVKTYFICYNADRSKATAHGIVEPTLQMQTGQPIMDSFTDEIKWLKALLLCGIDPNEKLDEELPELPE
jgi:hypothetical protein